MLTLPLLVIAGQLADGLAYQLAHGNGTELNPAMDMFSGVFGPFAILGVKLVAALVLGVGAVALHRHPRLVIWIAVAGFVGAGSELLAVV